MWDYLLLLGADALLALNFAVNKAYQKREGVSLQKSLKYNMILGLFSALLFSAFQGFRVEFTLFSALMACAVTLVVVSYTVIGFRIMARGQMALYTIFLMCGGMILPYIWGVAFLGEPFVPLRMVGLMIITAAVAVSNADKSRFDAKLMLMLIAVFLLNGCTSIISKMHQIQPGAVQSASFIVLASLAKVILCGAGLLFLRLRGSREEESTTARETLRGIGLPLVSLALIAVSALFDGGSYLLQLLGAKDLPASVMYAIVTGGAIVFTALAGRAFFKEKITRRMALGIGLCLVGASLFFF